MGNSISWSGEYSKAGGRIGFGIETNINTRTVETGRYDVSSRRIGGWEIRSYGHVFNGGHKTTDSDLVQINEYDLTGELVKITDYRRSSTGIVVYDRTVPGTKLA